MKPKLPISALIIALSTGIVQAQTENQESLHPPNSTTANAERALTEALTGPDGEFAAQAVYESILRKFGEMQPYAAIVKSEACHINALKRHFERRGWAVPGNPHTSLVPLPATLKESAELAASAEERNIAMYDRLLSQTTDQPDLVRVFEHLQWASREHHLPTLQAAVTSNGQLSSGLACSYVTGKRRGPRQGDSPVQADSVGSCAGQKGCAACGAAGLGRGPGKAGAGKGLGRGRGASPGFHGGQRW